MDSLSAGLRIGPFAQFLREPAVVGMGTPPVGQPLGVHQRFHPLIGLFGVDAAPGVEFRHRPPLDRGVRVQRKMHQDGFDIIRRLEFLDTHGD